MNKLEILTEIDIKGFIWDRDGDDEIIKLYLEGVICSVGDLGIRFMNQDYCFTYTDNRYHVRVFHETPNLSYIVSDLTKINNMINCS